MVLPSVYRWMRAKSRLRQRHVTVIGFLVAPPPQRCLVRGEHKAYKTILGACMHWRTVSPGSPESFIHMYMLQCLLASSKVL